MLPKTCSKKNKKFLTKTESAAANSLFLRLLAELAMVLTSQIVTNAKLAPKRKKKISTKTESAAANFLFLRPLAELAMVNTSQMMTNGTQNCSKIFKFLEPFSIL